MSTPELVVVNNIIGRKLNTKRRKRNRGANNKKKLTFNTNYHTHTDTRHCKPEHVRARERDNSGILQNQNKRTISRETVGRQRKIFYLTLNNNADQVLHSDLRVHHHFDAFCEKASPTLYLWMQSILKWTVNQKRIANNAKFNGRVRSMDIYFRSTATAITVHVLFAIIAELWTHHIVGLLRTTAKEAIHHKAAFYSPYVLEEVPGVYSTQKQLRQLICYLLHIPNGFVIEIVVMQPPPTDTDKYRDNARTRTKGASMTRQRACRASATTQTVYVWLYNYQRTQTQQTPTTHATATSATATIAETIDGGHNDSNEDSSRQRFRRLPTLALTTDDRHTGNHNHKHSHTDSSDSITMAVANTSIIMRAIKASNLIAINMQMDVHSSSMSKNNENYSEFAHDHSTHHEEQEPHHRKKKTENNNQNTSTNTVVHDIPMTVVTSPVSVVIKDELKTDNVFCRDPSEIESAFANNANPSVNANTVLGKTDRALNAKQKTQQKNISCIESEHPKSNKMCDFPGISDDDDENESERECNNDIGIHTNTSTTTTMVANTTTRKRKMRSIERNWNSTDSGSGTAEEESSPCAQPKKRMKMSTN